jgi:hypothetical protein
LTIPFTILLLLAAACSHAQSPEDSLIHVSAKYLEKVTDKASSLEKSLDKKTTKALSKLQRQEDRMKRKLVKIDSLAANNIFSDASDKYKNLSDRLKNNSLSGPYLPKLDSLATSIKFLEQNPQLIKQLKESKEKLKDVLSKVDGLKDQFNKAEAIKQFLKERRQFLKEQLSKFGFAKKLKRFNKEVYYYAQQVNEYKEILKDSKKAERKALELLSRTKLFKDFMRKNSQLASLFSLPDPNDPSSQTNLAGLQTRAQVNALIQNQIAAGGPGAQQQFQQNLQDAQSQLQQLKDKMSQFGASSSDEEMPDFKPNNQKTKSFLKRLEYGTSIQTQKANSIFPVTSDIGLSVGYKINDKNVVGIGSSFKMGWGSGWRNIRISSQGVGMRSYLDYKLKGSLWISGGFEMNYRSEINDWTLLKDRSAWQQSGLMGLSKLVSLKTKFFKKTKLQLLWDFLSYEQVPRTQPLVFRIGYTF